MARKIIDSHCHICQWNTDGVSFIDAFKNYKEKCGLYAVNTLSLPMAGESRGVYSMAQNIVGAILKLEDETAYSYGGLFYPEAPINDTLAEKFDFKAQAEEFMAIGFDGIKLLESKPSLHKKLSYGIDKKGYDAFFKYIEDNNIPMNSHVADPHDFWDEEKVPPIFKEKGWFYGDGTYASIEEIYGEVYNVLDRFPGIRITLPHGFFMGHCLQELAKVMDKYPNTSIDLAPGPALFQASVGKYDEFKAFFEKYYNRIIFGTDANNYSDFETLTKPLCSDVYRFFATDDEYTAFGYYDSTCTIKGMGLSDEKVRAIECDNFVKLAGDKPKKVDRVLLRKYIEKFLPYMPEDDTKKLIIDYCKEKL